MDLTQATQVSCLNKWSILSRHTLRINPKIIFVHVFMCVALLVRVLIQQHNKTKNPHYFENKGKIAPLFSTSTKPSNGKQEHVHHKHRTKNHYYSPCRCCNKTQFTRLNKKSHRQKHTLCSLPKRYDNKGKKKVKL